VHALINNGHDVVIVDNLCSGFLSNIEMLPKSKINFVQIDILNDNALLQAFKGIETVFHLAAKTSVPESIKDPTFYVKTNTIGTLNVMHCAKQMNVKNIVIASSASVYGDNPIVPKKESMSPQPKSPYAVSKLDGEYYADIYRIPNKLNISALRFFNVYGPRQDPNSTYAAAIPIFIEKALQNKPLIIYGDGEQTRDFIYAADVAHAVMLAAGANDVFNVGCNQHITISDIAHKIIKICNSKSAIIYAPERPGDIKHSYADTCKIIQALQFNPLYSLDEGLNKTIEYYRDIL
jgi:UDP-glucose 4-epimerase